MAAEEESVGDAGRYPVLRARLIAWYCKRGLQRMAEELADRVLLRCVESERRNGRGTSTGLVFKAAQDVLVDFWRRQGEHEPPLLVQAGVDWREPDLSEAEATRLLGLLRPRERRAVLLRVEGYRYAEIGVRLGTTEQAIKLLFHRLRLRLRTGRPAREPLGVDERRAARSCAACGELFSPRWSVARWSGRPPQRYCSRACANRRHAKG